MPDFVPGPTGAGWTAMPVTQSHSNDIHDYAVGWTWSDAPTAVVGTSNATGTGVFGFRVYKNIAGSQSVGLNENVSFVAKIRYRVIVTNAEAIQTYDIARLALEMCCLAYASSNPLPTIGSGFFDGRFGTVTGTTNLTVPVVVGFNCEPESEADPSIWLMTFTVSKMPTTGPSSRPDTGNDPTKPNTEAAPWVLGPETVIDFASEDFVLGLGRFIGAKTPAELDAALTNNTYAGLFTGTGAFEMVANSAGDPLESPPPMKVGTATIRITRAFETVPVGFAAALNAANEQVCSEAITVNGRTFAAYTCKLNGGTITQRKWRRQADWLPKQKHPFKWTYLEVGWTPPSGKEDGDVAINYTRNALPAYEYINYYEIAVSIASRDLGWGYALIDKGYREKRDGKMKEITDFHASQSYSRILAEGLEIDTSTGTTNQKVLRLYQVLKVGTSLSSVVNTMLGV